MKTQKFDYNTVLAKAEYNSETLRRFQYFNNAIKSTDKVLDITGGATLFCRYYKCKDLHLIDMDNDILHRAKNYAHTYNIDIDEEKMPFKNESFNVIIAGEIIEHLRNVEDLIIQCRNLLKDNGTFIGSTPNSFAIRGRIEKFFGKQTDNPLTTDHIRFYNYKILKSLLEKYFVNVEIKSTSTIQFYPPLFASGFMWKCTGKKQFAK